MIHVHISRHDNKVDKPQTSGASTGEASVTASDEANSPSPQLEDGDIPALVKVISSSDTVAETEETGNSGAASESNDASTPPLCDAVDNREPTEADILTQLLEWSRETSGQYGRYES